MKYEMVELSTGAHALTRYGEIVDHDPTNAEIEFWLEIERLRELESDAKLWALFRDTFRDNMGPEFTEGMVFKQSLISKAEAENERLRKLLKQTESNAWDVDRNWK